MRAVRFPDYGPPEVLSVDDVPDPRPGAGDVLVRVSAAGIGFADVQLRAGLMRAAGLELPLPYPPGFEVAGTVVEVGTDADPALLGRRIVGAVPGGGYAELAVLPAGAARALPDGLDDHTALALLGQGATAVGVADAAGVTADDTVLVEAAAGGVGSLLVQLAKRAGATVIATARGEAKLAVATGLGADATVDNAAPDWADRVRAAADRAHRGRAAADWVDRGRAAAGGVTVVLESTGGAVSRAAFDLLTPGVGRMVGYGTSSGAPIDVEAAQVYQRGVSLIGFASVVLPPDRRVALVDRAFALADAGELRPVLGPTWPLAEAAAAHRALESRATTGKTALIP